MINIYENLKYKNMIKDVSSEELAKEMFSKSFTFYTGFDPTFKSLTVGHLVQIIRIKYLSDHGFKPVILIGGATGLIGDPREVGERKILPLEQSLENAKLLKKQLVYFLGVKITYVNNYDWIKDISLISFLRDYGKFFNVNYMISKDVVKKRLAEGISYTEFSYMLLQAIDFLYLYKNYQVSCQFGGSDQWGNITAGLELIRKKISPNEKVLGISSHLLLNQDGKKIGKSEGGAIYLDKELTSPYEMYQYFLNVQDVDLIQYLKLLTLYDKDKILNIINAHEKDKSKRIGQTELASFIVSFVHGKSILEKVQNITKILFTSNYALLKEDEAKMLFASNTFKINLNDGILKILTTTNLAVSNREAREFIKSKAIEFNGIKLTDENQVLTKDMLLFSKYAIIKRGKKKFALAKI